ncbi:response regulator transcription factor [Sphingobacterium spiritivorum]|uniref:response regulator transcription factor n=1 Tax=Sphingobacterium spiritivorum TaxID=258 RepID=UPI00191804F3|nr:response regulator transcription factor [Sphingobacterium spiritivorum]QQT24627.1 response regulator transcription factor [Sphingobacterium spiritivorum]
MIEIMITDDHPMVLEGLKNVLATEDDLNLAACFTDGASLISGLKKKQPDILLLDINLPDINSIELVAKLKSAHPEMKIIALSVHNEFAVINSMLTEGASGYIQKNASGAEIITGIQTVYNGGRFLCAQSKLIMDKKTAEGLRNVPKITRREKEILQEAAKGLTSTEIADVLFISTHTVESHRKNLIEKFKVKNIASVIGLALEYGLIRK